MNDKKCVCGHYESDHHFETDLGARYDCVDPKCDCAKFHPSSVGESVPAQPATVQCVQCGATFPEALIDEHRASYGRFTHTEFRKFREQAQPAPPEPAPFNLRDHLLRQMNWSQTTFGPGYRGGVVDHIRKELLEIEAAPLDLKEWVDVIILGFDGAWRSGHSPDEIITALEAKQTKNEKRRWPDWRTVENGKAIEHVRGGEHD